MDLPGGRDDKSLWHCWSTRNTTASRGSSRLQLTDIVGDSHTVLKC